MSDMLGHKAMMQLNDLITTYKELSEKQKFVLAKVFQDATGGKLSPFNSPSPVCVGVIPVTGPNGEVGFLGVRRAIPPFIGEVALAGGFQNTNEDPVTGVVREVLEETGISIDPSTIEIAGIPKMAHNNNLLMFFKSTEVLSYETLQKAQENLQQNTDGEASELVFVGPNTPLCFPLHQEAVNAAFASRGVKAEVEVAKSFKI